MVTVAGGSGEVVGPAAAQGGTSAVVVAVARVVAVPEEDEVPGRGAVRAVAGSSGRAG